MLSPDPKALTTERLILRQWRESDHEPFARLNADPTVMEFMGRQLTRDESEAMAVSIHRVIESRGWGLWAVEVRNGAPFIGFVGLAIPTFDAHFTPCVEIAWRLAHEHWNRGYATEAATASLRFAFQEMQLPQVVSFTAALNIRSTRVMERSGMSRDLAGDFEHPRLAPSHPLRPHVLYRADRDAWLNRS
jgi:RimJ/RimL family protein N-acetyltransferase